VGWSSLFAASIFYSKSLCLPSAKGFSGKSSFLAEKKTYLGAICIHMFAQVQYTTPLGEKQLYFH